MFIVGVDIAKRSHEAIVLEDSGKVVHKAFSFKNDVSGFQRLYREILAVADNNGGKLPNRAVFYCDEFGTLPKIESAEMMFSASRSRRLSIVSIIQSLGQLEKNYGKEGAEIIVDNTQLTIFVGFSPNSETAQPYHRGVPLPAGQGQQGGCVLAGNSHHGAGAEDVSKHCSKGSPRFDKRKLSCSKDTKPGEWRKFIQFIFPKNFQINMLRHFNFHFSQIFVSNSSLQMKIILYYTLFFPY